uniref:Uncharacterized protein n=1 Tax=Brassica oleracea var. oleracea TaxID=109376 RepID=A0A0D3B3J5_BRAOL
MSSSDVVAQSAFDVLRLGRSSQFIVARLLRFLTNGNQNLNRSSVAGSTRVCNPGKASWSRVKMMPIGSTVCDAIVKDRSLVTCWCSSWSAGAAISRLSLWTIKKFFLSYSNMIFKDLSRLKRFNSEEAIEYRLIIVRPPRIKDDAPLQDET